MSVRNYSDQPMYTPLKHRRLSHKRPVVIRPDSSPSSSDSEDFKPMFSGLHFRVRHKFSRASTPTKITELDRALAGDVQLKLCELMEAAIPASFPTKSPSCPLLLSAASESPSSPLLVPAAAAASESPLLFPSADESLCAASESPSSPLLFPATSDSPMSPLLFPAADGSLCSPVLFPAESQRPCSPLLFPQEDDQRSASPSSFEEKTLQKISKEPLPILNGDDINCLFQRTLQASDEDTTEALLALITQPFPGESKASDITNDGEMGSVLSQVSVDLTPGQRTPSQYTISSSSDSDWSENEDRHVTLLSDDDTASQTTLYKTAREIDRTALEIKTLLGEGGNKLVKKKKKKMAGNIVDGEPVYKCYFCNGPRARYVTYCWKHAPYSQEGDPLIYGQMNGLPKPYIHRQKWRPVNWEAFHKKLRVMEQHIINFKNEITRQEEEEKEQIKWM